VIKIRKRFGNLLARPDQWKKIIKAATRMKAAAPFSPVSDHLTKTANFGPNPGALQMFSHLPTALPDQCPLLVVLHGCTQSAAGYDLGAGWSTLADRFEAGKVAAPQQGADFAKDVSDRTKATAEVTNKAAGEAYATFASGTVEFHRQWIEMIRANSNATLDFVHQVLGVKSPSAFVELSAEHARKQAEAFAEQARHLTGMAQKLTTVMAAPMQAGMKNVFNKAA
jgi:phasin family protein